MLKSYVEKFISKTKYWKVKLTIFARIGVQNFVRKLGKNFKSQSWTASFAMSMSSREVKLSFEWCYGVFEEKL